LSQQIWIEDLKKKEQKKKQKRKTAKKIGTQ